MAVGRGEFFRSFLAGLERQSSGRGPPPPGWSGEESRCQAEPQNRQAGCRDRKRPQRAAFQGGTPSSVSVNVHHLKSTTSKQHHLDRLPQEVLMKILSFLDASSLFCVSRVSSLFHRLANDDALWRRVYMVKFGSGMWRPRAESDLGMRAEPPLGQWKKMFLRTVAGQEANRWKRELREVWPDTGLPRHTELILRELSVSWELTLCDRLGQELRLRQSSALFLQAAVLLRWTHGFVLRFHHLSSIQLHGVRREVQRTGSALSSSSSSSSSRPGWRSLILKLDLQRERWSSIGRDRLIKLIVLPQGVLVATWRSTNTVAFIMISLHFHKLVEKSLLGSPACPYSDPSETPLRPPHPRAFSLHLVLNNMAAEILSGHFPHVSCRRVRFDGSVLEMKVVEASALSQHRPLSGDIRLQWKSLELEGAVENCCVMTLTLLDRSHAPCWCVSAPVRLRAAPRPRPHAAYAGEHFLLDHRQAGGTVRMTLLRLKEQKQFFLIGLCLYLSPPTVGVA